MLTPRFNPDHMHYTAQVGGARTDVQIIPTATSQRYSALTINEIEHDSNSVFSAPLAKGENLFEISVVSPDGSVRNTYTLTITR